VDLILLDILLPGMDGHELYRRIHASAANAGTPVIFLSALADREAVIRGLRLGAADYITKPFHPEEVLVRVARHLQLRRLQRELETRNRSLEEEVAERRRVEEQLASALETMERLAQQDGLTGLANRRYLDEYLMQEWQRLRREEASLALILTDVDHFKHYNDSLGHLAGDDALRAVAGALRAVLRRPADLAARYGGEEFALVLPHTELEGALVVAGALREAVAALALPHPASDWPHISLSLGVAARVPQGDDPAPLLRAADAALYRAKAGGRNRIHENPLS
jgi:diguanylate cyclase (GGDEF)-like protein